MIITEPFPGPLKRVEKSFGNWRIVIMPNQERWIRNHFTDQSIPVADIANEVGVSRTWLNTWCNDHGIYRQRSKGLRDFNAAKARSGQAIATATRSTTKIEPDADLLRAIHEDDDREPLGPCLGKTCLCYSQCCGHKGVKLAAPSECNAMF